MSFRECKVATAHERGNEGNPKNSKRHAKRTLRAEQHLSSVNGVSVSAQPRFEGIRISPGSIVEGPVRGYGLASKRFVSGHGFRGCGKTLKCVQCGGRAALQRRVKRAESAWASAPGGRRAPANGVFPQPLQPCRKSSREDAALAAAVAAKHLHLNAAATPSSSHRPENVRHSATTTRPATPASDPRHRSRNSLAQFAAHSLHRMRSLPRRRLRPGRR